MAIDQKVTDRVEKVEAPDSSMIHFVDVTDVSQSQEGSSYKISKANFLKEIQNIDGVKTYQELADLPDPASMADGIPAKVANDLPNNGYYSIVSGTWVKDADLYENTIDASNTSKGVTGKAVKVFVDSKNPNVEPNMPNLPTFSDGSDLHLGTFIKNIKITFADGVTPYKTNGDLRRLRVNNINYLSATQVYVSWYYESKISGENSIAGSNYYVNIGSDISNIPFSYSASVDGDTINFEGVFDFSSIVEGVNIGATPADYTNGKINDDVLLNSFVNNYNKQSKLKADGTIELSGVAGVIDKLSTNNDELLEAGKNLYQENTANKTSGYLDASGNIIAHATAFITNYIPIYETLEYAYQGVYAQATKFVTYDKDYNIVRILPLTSPGAVDTGTFTAETNEVFARFSVRNENEFMLEYGNSQSAYEPFSRLIKDSLLPNNNLYSSLEVVGFGDSITALSTNWTTSFKEITGVTNFTNMAISGQKICWRAGTTETTNPPINADDNNVFWNSILKYQDLYPTATPDVIIIALGTNDISQSSPLGTYADAFAQSEALTSQQTMAGAYRKAIFKLMTDYPDAQIFYCTPLQSITGFRNYDNLLTVTEINSEISGRMNVKIIDCFRISGIQEEFENDGSAGRYYTDGTHPNTAGAVMHGKTIAKEFMNHYYFNN